MMSSLILCLQRPPRHYVQGNLPTTKCSSDEILGIMRNATQFPVRTEWYCCVSWLAQHYNTLAVDNVTSGTPSRLLCGNPLPLHPLHLAGILCVYSVLQKKILFLYFSQPFLNT